MRKPNANNTMLRFYKIKICIQRTTANRKIWKGIENNYIYECLKRYVKSLTVQKNDRKLWNKNSQISKVSKKSLLYNIVTEITNALRGSTVDNILLNGF